MQQSDLEQLYYDAQEQFPYELTPTYYEQGELCADETGMVEFSSEFIFPAGLLLNDELTAGGWIDVRRDTADDDVSISGLFGVARNFDWKNGLVLPEYTGIHAVYDITAKQWELWIDTY